MLAECQDLSLNVRRDQAVRKAERRLERIRHAGADARPHRDAVHDDLNVVLDVLVKDDLFVKIPDFAVHARPHESAALCVFEKFFVAALLAAHDRCEDLDAGPFGITHQLLDHLVDGLPADLAAAVRAVGDAHPRIQKAQVIVDLRHGPHGRARVPVRRLLVNGNGRRKAGDGLDVRLVHLSQELSRVGGKRLHVAPLPFRVNGLEGKRGLARTGETRQHHQFVPRNVHVQML